MSKYSCTVTKSTDTPLKSKFRRRKYRTTVASTFIQKNSQIFYVCQGLSGKNREEEFYSFFNICEKKFLSSHHVSIFRDFIIILYNVQIPSGISRL